MVETQTDQETVSMTRRDGFEQTMAILSKLSVNSHKLSHLITAVNTSHDIITPRLLKLKNAGAIKEEATLHGSNMRYFYHITSWGKEILTHYQRIVEMMKGD